MSYIVFIFLIILLYMLYSNKSISGYRRNRYIHKPLNKVNTDDKLNIDHKFNSYKIDKIHEVNRILDKISNKGIKSLNSSEIEFLNKYSKSKPK